MISTMCRKNTIFSIFCFKINMVFNSKNNVSDDIIFTEKGMI